jgi:hypothetical protein
MDEISTQLRRLSEVLQRKGADLEKCFYPGLTPEKVAASTARLPFRIPSEISALYQWQNGSPEDSLLLFRDQRFLPLNEAIRECESIASNFNLANEHHLNLRTSLPFAAFDGSWYVVPTEEQNLRPDLERPVISVFEGIDVYFLSVGAMLDTVIEWFETGVTTFSESGEDLRDPRAREKAIAHAKWRDEREREIWRKHNPGLNL